jgi:hypothetical protein
MANTPKKRTASEAIISLEQRVERMEGLLKSIDHNVKLQLSRQNVQLTVPSGPVLMPGPVTVSAPTASAPIGPAPTVEAVEFPQVEIQPATNVKRVVQEKVTYGDSKVIIIAQVEIFDMAGKLIDKKQTNNAGKWTSSLLPGKYLVRVAKQRTSTKPQATGQYEILVPPGNKPLQLGNRKL